MEKKTVKISIKPVKIAIFGALIIIVASILFLRKPGQRSSTTGDSGTNSIVLPQETGVVDTGFESGNTGVTVFNTKAILDDFQELDGKKSLKISFSDLPNASVKLASYFNNVEEGKFYRLAFWASTNASSDKKININLIDGEKVQNLGQVVLKPGKNVQYFEINFEASNNASDLILNSTDSVQADVWVDDFSAEGLNIDSADQLSSMSPTVFGDTSIKNVDQSSVSAKSSGNETSAAPALFFVQQDQEQSQKQEQKSSGADSGNFLSEAGNKIGQIFSPSQAMLSGAAFKIQKVGNGGVGSYKVQLREYDDKLGIISDKISASRNIYDNYPPSMVEEMQRKEKTMRDDFAKNEEDIKDGRILNDLSVDQYPPSFTQDQIDAAKADKRKDKLEVAIADMKESYNAPEEIEIPIAAQLDTNKKYWIGIDNSGVKVDRNNYIKVFQSSGNSGFSSDTPNVWQASPTLWFKTFYPSHSKVDGQELLSGATISDFGNGKLLYRYAFDNQGFSSLSGFAGKKIYDMAAGVFESSDAGGNYLLSSPDQYATYRFNTLYPAKKVIIRNATYNQSLAVDFSTDGENWKEVFSANPSDDNQTIDPITITPDTSSSSFYLRMKPDGSSATLSSLSLEAELEKSAN